MTKKIVVLVLGLSVALIQAAFGVALVREGICDHGQPYSDRVRLTSNWARSVVRCQYAEQSNVDHARYEQAGKGKLPNEQVAVAALSADYRANQIAAAQLRVSILEAITVTIALSVAAVGLLVQAVELRRRRRR